MAAGLPVDDEVAAVVDAWREAHAEPLEWMTSSVRRRIESISSSSAVANRLKRKPQIVAKLARGNSMRLAQMQDIGGCRIVLDNAEYVAEAAARIKSRSRPNYVVKSEADYRSSGRARTGYRALHLVVERDERRIEIQLRTRRQHLWAEAVERAATRTEFALKDGRGPDDLVEYFRLASDGVALLEEEVQIPAWLRHRFRELDHSISRYFPDRPLKPMREAKLRPSGPKSKPNYWILIYSWRDAKFEWWSNLGPDSEDAAGRYAAYEKEYPPSKGYEVVLIGADSAETIQRTHAHYFARSADDLDPQGLFRELL